MDMKVYVSADDFEVTDDVATLKVDIPIMMPVYITKVEIKRLLQRLTD